jgi:hypothetical protein
MSSDGDAHCNSTPGVNTGTRSAKQKKQDKRTHILSSAYSLSIVERTMAAAAPSKSVSFPEWLDLALQANPLALAEAAKSSFDVNYRYPIGDCYTPLHAA